MSALTPSGTDQQRSRDEEQSPGDHEPRSPDRPSRAVTGRALDLVGTCLAIVVFAPLMAAIAVAVKLDDRGPVLFGQERIGRNGRTFRMRKFRTMVVGAELDPIDTVDEHGRSLGPLFNVASDPRATRFGRALRRTGLDELPQLFNVLAGEMSLVGPRPALPSEVAIFDAGLRRREIVLPGVTGLWQVLAHNNPSLDVYRQLDLYYVDHCGVVGDVAILGWTLGQVLARCAGRRPG
ncbi:MAG: sugar transferase [Ilumatobacteraceae bacterium]